jgi:hypothetical protein
MKCSYARAGPLSRRPRTADGAPSSSRHAASAARADEPPPLYRLVASDIDYEGGVRRPEPSRLPQSQRQRLGHPLPAVPRPQPRPLPPSPKKQWPPLAQQQVAVGRPGPQSPQHNPVDSDGPNWLVTGIMQTLTGDLQPAAQHEGQGGTGVPLPAFVQQKSAAASTVTAAVGLQSVHPDTAMRANDPGQHPVTRRRLTASAARQPRPPNPGPSKTNLPPPPPPPPPQQQQPSRPRRGPPHAGLQMRQENFAPRGTGMAQPVLHARAAAEPVQARGGTLARALPHSTSQPGAQSCAAASQPQEYALAALQPPSGYPMTRWVPGTRQVPGTQRSTSGVTEPPLTENVLWLDPAGPPYSVQV